MECRNPGNISGGNPGNILPFIPVISGRMTSEQRAGLRAIALLLIEARSKLERLAAGSGTDQLHAEISHAHATCSGLANEPPLARKATASG